MRGVSLNIINFSFIGSIIPEFDVLSSVSDLHSGGGGRGRPEIIHLNHVPNSLSVLVFNKNIYCFFFFVNK